MNFPTNKKNVAIIDFEATCSKGKEVPFKEMEIIEFACIVIDRELQEIGRFDRFVKPVRHPTLTEFCTNLTTITQEQVDSGSKFSEVLLDFSKFIKPFDPLFASWGRYDKNQLIKDCTYHEVEYPFDDEHLDIKRWVPQFYNFSRPKGIGRMLKRLRLKFEGTPHRGIDDVHNIVRILKQTRETILQG